MISMRSRWAQRTAARRVRVSFAPLPSTVALLSHRVPPARAASASAASGAAAGSEARPLDRFEVAARLEPHYRAAVPGMKWYRLLGALAAIGACAYYYADYRVDDNLLSETVKSLGASDSTTVASALAALDAALAHRQRSLGGSATLSTTATELVERGVVDALLCALALPALGESERLQALRVVAMLARQSERAAQRLAAAQHAPMLAQLFAGRVSIGGEGGALLAGAALIAALSDPDARETLLADRVCASVLASAPAKLAGPLHELMSRAVSAAAGHRAPLTGAEGAALDAALESLVPSHLSGAAQRDERVGKLLNIAGIGLFGAVYGRVRWFVRLATAGTGLSVRQIGVHAAKRSRVGVWLAAIFALDAGLNSWLLPNWSTIRDDIAALGDDASALEKYQPVVDAPARLTIPSISAVLSATLCTVAISRQRFVVLPLTLALGISHWDIVSESAVGKEAMKQLKSMLN